MRLARQSDESVDASARDHVRARVNYREAATTTRLAEQDDEAVDANARDDDAPR